MLAIWLFVIGNAIAVACGIFLYNKLVRYRYLVREAYSDIDIQLKRRHDLIPKIINVIQGYSEYEKKLFEKITSIRTQLETTQPLSQKVKTENQFSGCLKNIFALAEAYPNLKANEGFLQFQETISQIEDDLQLARRYYNGTVRDYNVLRQQFPSSLLAAIFNFKAESFFELEYSTERKSPDVRFM